MPCAKSPLPARDVCYPCEGVPTPPHPISDDALLQQNQTLQSQVAKFSAVCLYTALFCNVALRRSCIIMSINSRSFESIRVRSSLLSHLVSLSWTGVKQSNVREQG